MDIDAYLERIGLVAAPAPTLDSLATLQLAHLLTIPFENLDIVSGVPISLDQEALFDKIVAHHRGGFCYELNGLFAVLLERLGYRVTRLSARTVDGIDGTIGPEFDHLVLRVDLDEPWLVDVGFGDSARAPMPLRSGQAFVDPLGRSYRLDASSDGWGLSERGTPEAEGRDIADATGRAEWRTTFLFTLAPHRLEDFVETCRWQETESPWFTGHRFCTIATADGRTTLLDDRLIERVGEMRTERPVDEAEVPVILRERFGISP